MTSTEIRSKIKMPIFSRADVLKHFPKEPPNQINTQLHRMMTRGDLVGIKRGLYCFPGLSTDEFVLANKIYEPSYVSLESALNIYGVIPDIVANVVSVTPITSKRFITPFGDYLYSKIARALFFGYTEILDEHSSIYYNIATPEKALLDLIYIRKIKDLIEYRVDLSNINKKKLINYSTHFPEWVRKALKNE